MGMDKLKFIDLFAGIGGFRIAFEETGYECVYSCEIDPKCQEVYFNNFSDKPAGDIRKIDINSIPEFDVLTAGFPCQPFSICGKRKGFQDTRGTLFFRICEIIAAKKPPVILLENVKHLMYQDKGRTLKVILYSLEDLGYKVNYSLLNSKDFGVPQNRERIIIIATKNKQFNFDKLKTINSRAKLINFLSDSEKFEYLEPDSYTLIDQPKQQQSGLIFVGYRNNKSIWKKGVRPNTHHLSRVHHQPNRIYSVEGIHPTIPSQETSGRFFIYLPKENAVRKLTIKECYRIMGFPENFKLHNNLGECYKQVGNSVCIPMVSEIAHQLKEQIFLGSQEEENGNDFIA
ncbi:DNA cytosine methyltransferase, partial [Coleofasciculus sp.]|uniref:DNA cytosine methyltransferase n=1 Tax=Coleofasciculus sp. TaxID=3100458 RepID=UPI003A43068B